MRVRRVPWSFLAVPALLATVACGALTTATEARDDSSRSAAGSRAHKRCTTKGREVRGISRLIVVTHFVKVTKIGETGGTTIACWRRTGLERRVDGYDVVIAGAWVAAAHDLPGMNHDNEQPPTVTATDVRTGRGRDLDWEGVSGVSADQVVLKRNGAFAVLGHDYQGTAPIVAAVDHSGGRTLSTSPEIVAGSLTLDGGHVSWREGATVRTARLP
jgi:hypothetical protein